MFGLFDYLKLGVGALAGAALVSFPAYFYGVSQGKQQASIDALEMSVEYLRQKEDIQNEVSISDAATLCNRIGLPVGQIPECMRRVNSVNSKP